MLANSLDACGMRFIEEIAGHWSLRYALLLKRLRSIGACGMRFY